MMDFALGASMLGMAATIAFVATRVRVIPAGRSWLAREWQDDNSTPEPSSVTAMENGNQLSEIAPSLDRELALLAFSARILQLAKDTQTPARERLHYLSIVAGNLDEFFAVQMARRVDDDTSKALTGADIGYDGIRRVYAYATVLANELHVAVARSLEALALHGINVRKVSALSTTALAELRATFALRIQPQLAPREIWPAPDAYWRDMPALEHALAVVYVDRLGIRRCDGIMLSDAKFGFQKLAASSDFVSVTDIMQAHIDALYEHARVEFVAPFRVTRRLDAPELTILNDVQQNGTADVSGRVSRIEFDNALPREDRLKITAAILCHGEAAHEVAIIVVPELFDLDAVRAMAGTLPDDAAFPQLTSRNVLPEESPIWDLLSAEDLFVHHPHDNFTRSVVRFFNDAADDAAVQSIQIVLYRLGDQSPIADALIRAANNGKRVSAVIELRARGDEQRNRAWAERLEAAGVEVIRGTDGLRSHAKIALVERSEAHGVMRYAHVGTGNYNVATAGSYTDFGVFTTHSDVCDDLGRVFQTLRNGKAKEPNGRTANRIADIDKVSFWACLAGPKHIRKGILQRIARETEHARAGRPARIRMKMNGLADRSCIDALYEASQAGVTVELIVRGICTLRPGVPGLSENIRVTSIIGRFLEHARVFAFDNDGNPEYFIGSADLRPRNLRRRVELLVPLLSPAICARMDAILEHELSEPGAWKLNSDGSYNCQGLDDRANTPAASLVDSGSVLS